MAQALFLIADDIHNSIARIEQYLEEQNTFCKKCGKPACRYCERIGIVKLTFAKTKPLILGMLESLIADSSPRLIIRRHVRPEYGNYQAWIMPDGHYVNIWGYGHSPYRRECVSEDVGDRMIKVHAQSSSNIHIYCQKEPPTAEQIETLRDVYADAIFHGYEQQYKLNLLFNYDTHHPNFEEDYED